MSQKNGLWMNRYTLSYSLFFKTMMDAAGLPLGFGYIHIYFDAAICYRSCRNAWEKTWRLLSAAPVICIVHSSTISSFIPPNTRPFFATFFPHPLLHPRPPSSYPFSPQQWRTLLVLPLLPIDTHYSINASPT